MPRPVDFPRVRRALAALDRIAAEHPEICQGVGQWDESAVENIVMATPAKERVAAYRARRAAQGIKRVTFFCSPEAQEALRHLREAQPGNTVDETICAALVVAVQPPQRLTGVNPLTIPTQTPGPAASPTLDALAADEIITVLSPMGEISGIPESEALSPADPTETETGHPPVGARPAATATTP